MFALWHILPIVPKIGAKSAHPSPQTPTTKVPPIFQEASTKNDPQTPDLWIREANAVDSGDVWHTRRQLNDERGGEVRAKRNHRSTNKKEKTRIATFPARRRNFGGIQDRHNMSPSPSGFFSAPKFRPVTDVQYKRGPAAMEADNREVAQIFSPLAASSSLPFSANPEKCARADEAESAASTNDFSKHRIIEGMNCGELTLMRKYINPLVNIGFRKYYFCRK